MLILKEIKIKLFKQLFNLNLLSAQKRWHLDKIYIKNKNKKIKKGQY